MSHFSIEEFDEQCKEEKVIYTHCKGCVFFKDFEDEEHSLDDHCYAGRLSKFNESGSEIVDIQDEDDESHSKAVKGRVCNMLRGDVWKLMLNRGKQKTSFQKTEEEALEEMRSLAERECIIKCAVVIYVPRKNDVDVNARFESIKETLVSIKNNEIQPSQIILVNNANIMPSNFVPAVRSLFDEIGLKCPWRMEYILDENEGYNKDYNNVDLPGKITNIEEGQQSYEICVDIALRKVKSQYAAIFFDGYIIPSNFFSSINEKINSGLGRFILVLPDDNSKSGTIIQMMAYKQLKGNKEIDFVTKALSKVQEQKCEYMIKKLSEIVAPPE